MQVGMIGLGRLGLPIALNLVDGGFKILGYRRHPESPLEAGGRLARSVAEVGSACEIVLTCLPTPEALADVISGPGGLVSSMRPGGLVIDLGTFPIAAKREQQKALQMASIAMLDCAVSGNYRYVKARSAALFVGGDARDYQRCAAVLAAITDHVTHVGDFGAGTTLKMIASLLVPVHTLAAAEAFALASRAGISLRTVFDAIKGSQASSAMFETRGAMMVTGDYHSGEIKLQGYYRNVTKTMELAAELGGNYPLLSAMEACFRNAIASGYGQIEPSGIIEFLLKDGSPSA